MSRQRGEFQEVESSPDGRYVRFDERIGVGAYKEVWRGYDTETGKEIAWNTIDLKRLPLSERQRIRHETEILQELEHPHIINFFNTWDMGATDDGLCDQICFATEIVTSGTLKQYISRVKGIKLKVIKKWCRQILLALDYLHSHQPPIIHRDLKCDNIFINGSTGEIRIGDFGMSSMRYKTHAESVLGTPEFMAPELYDENYSEKVDIYAFGMCVLEMSTKEYPFEECFAPNTQLLTIDGFKFVADITEDDKLATYNPTTQQVEYHRPLPIHEGAQAVYSRRLAPDEQLIEFASPAEQLHWSDTSDDYGYVRTSTKLPNKRNYKNHVCLTVTSNHTMYVNKGIIHCLSHDKKHQSRRWSKQWTTELAGSLLTVPACRFLAAPVNGVSIDESLVTTVNQLQSHIRNSLAADYAAEQAANDLSVQIVTNNAVVADIETTHTKQIRPIDEGPRRISTRTVRAYLASIGLEANSIPGDGNCMFRAIACSEHMILHPNTDPATLPTPMTDARADQLRQLTAQYHIEHYTTPEQIKWFMTYSEHGHTPQQHYNYLLHTKANSTYHNWGSNVDLQALADILSRDILYHDNTTQTIECTNSQQNQSINLVYHANHYEFATPRRIVVDTSTVTTSDDSSDSTYVSDSDSDSDSTSNTDSNSYSAQHLQRLRQMNDSTPLKAYQRSFEFVEALNIVNQTQFHIFLELFGYWLADGSIKYKYEQYYWYDSVYFQPTKPFDKQYMQVLLDKLGLRKGVDYRLADHPVKANYAPRDVNIINQRWFNYFHTRYGNKYIQSSQHIRELVDQKPHTQVFIKSAKYLPGWCWRLTKQWCRVVLEGIRIGDGTEHSGKGAKITTSSVAFRDQLIHFTLHAGYTSYFELQYRAGAVRNVVKGNKKGTPVVAKHDHWCVNYADETACTPNMRSTEDMRQVITKYDTVYCVTVPPHHLVVARQAHRNKLGVVTKASRAIIVGQCGNAAQIWKKVSLGQRPQVLQRLLEPQTKSFIELCLQSQDLRPTARELLKHPYLMYRKSDPIRDNLIVRVEPRVIANNDTDKSTTNNTATVQTGTHQRNATTANITQNDTKQQHVRQSTVANDELRKELREIEREHQDERRARLRRSNDMSRKRSEQLERNRSNSSDDESNSDSDDNTNLPYTHQPLRLRSNNNAVQAATQPSIDRPFHTPLSHTSVLYTPSPSPPPNNTTIPNNNNKTLPSRPSNYGTPQPTPTPTSTSTRTIQPSISVPAELNQQSTVSNNNQSEPMSPAVSSVAQIVVEVTHVEHGRAWVTLHIHFDNRRKKQIKFEFDFVNDTYTSIASEMVKALKLPDPLKTETQIATSIETKLQQPRIKYLESLRSTSPNRVINNVPTSPATSTTPPSTTTTSTVSHPPTHPTASKLSHTRVTSTLPVNVNARPAYMTDNKPTQSASQQKPASTTTNKTTPTDNSTTRQFHVVDMSPRNSNADQHLPPSNLTHRYTSTQDTSTLPYSSSTATSPTPYIDAATVDHLKQRVATRDIVRSSSADIFDMGRSTNTTSQALHSQLYDEYKKLSVAQLKERIISETHSSDALKNCVEKSDLIETLIQLHSTYQPQQLNTTVDLSSLSEPMIRSVANGVANRILERRLSADSAARLHLLQQQIQDTNQRTQLINAVQTLATEFNIDIEIPAISISRAETKSNTQPRDNTMSHSQSHHTLQHMLLPERTRTISDLSQPYKSTNTHNDNSAVHRHTVPHTGDLTHVRSATTLVGMDTDHHNTHVPIPTSQTLSMNDAKKLQKDIRRTTLEKEAQSAEARLLEFTKLAHPTHSAGNHIVSNIPVHGQQRIAPDSNPSNPHKSTDSSGLHHTPMSSSTETVQQ